MKVVKRSGSEARNVLLCMVVDPQVLGPISAQWESPGLFASRAENLVASWAVKHYKKYGKAPGKDIAGYYDRWADTQKDDDVSKFMGSFLQSLSDQHKRKTKPLSSAMALDAAARVFDKCKIERIQLETNALIERGEMEKAVQVASSFRRVEVATTSAILPFKGGPVVRNALRNVGMSLIKWPQEALNKFFASSLAREEFIAVTAPEKRGKSMILQEFAFQGVINGRNVAFFECGDQSQKQILRRFAARAAGRPFKIDECVRWPTSLTPSDEPKGTPLVVHEVREYEKKMSPQEADAAMVAFGKKYGSDKLKLTVKPNSSISILGIESILNDWKRDNWFPDIVIIDYLDILATLDGRADTRDQINATWKAARSLSQKFHCLLIGATQADADSYDAEIIDMGNFSEDKRKNAHCTGTIAINQTDEEKKQGLYRLNWTLARDLEFSTRTCVWVASCMPYAQPIVLACF